ncbi:zinc finger protein ZPR1 [Drosophila grimshawi]|uniref:Zinc finger protein ZPR1 n=1 Tax=Drosophila grimshawi TaxID=7222 RepID=B4JP15_DROGR|nr:zinc finger protein ZPR1 [Drosophila grimshawi]EDV92458.1 GH24932 [Drosophila grimshawi]
MSSVGSTTIAAESADASGTGSATAQQEPIFQDISGDQAVEVVEIESACMRCFKSGTTRLLPTKIPFFREVVLMSFKCDHCGYANNEMQSASEMQKSGVRIALDVQQLSDLNRRVVRSDHSSVTIPEVELEIPVQSQKGEVTTVEGIIERTITGLSQDQEKRRIDHPTEAASIDDYIDRLRQLTKLTKPFRLLLEDISGNSFIENPIAPANDPQLKTSFFTRTQAQNEQLGLYEQNHEENLLKPIAEDEWPIENLHGEVLQFATNCSNCQSPCETNMKLTNIPHFKEVVIMATVCSRCGHKTNEVKSGGGIEPEGVRFTVRITSKEDLTRDVLKSETCSLSIPELDMDVGPHALCGRFTTVEGLLVAMREQLDGTFFHDSADEPSKQQMQRFLDKYDDVLKMESSITLVLEDPAGNTYVQSLSDNGEPDDKLTVERYKRSYDDNEQLGLNDMKTENYEQEA